MDIISLPVEYDKKKIDSKYRLVAIASQRAKDLSMGARQKIQTKARKVATIAIEEAVDSKNSLEFFTGEEAIRAKEEAGTYDYRKLLEESRRLAMGEELSEIEKDLKVYLHEKEKTSVKAFDEIFSKESGEDSKK